MLKNKLGVLWKKPNNVSNADVSLSEKEMSHILGLQSKDFVWQIARSNGLGRKEKNGTQRQFNGGSVRDSNEGKPRFDLIPPESLLRLAKHYATGADKYGVDNYKKGEGMPREVLIESAYRHFEAMRRHEKDEDHVAACIWNLMTIAYFEEIGRDK